jgi:hypothetical protein
MIFGVVRRGNYEFVISTKSVAHESCLKPSNPPRETLGALYLFLAFCTRLTLILDNR